jgi:hypothetical protein
MTGATGYDAELQRHADTNEILQRLHPAAATRAIENLRAAVASDRAQAGARNA